MNDNIKISDAEKSERGIRAYLSHWQNKISSAPSSYLFFAFIIPVALTYLLYLSMGIHPFGDGSVLVLDLNGQYVYFFESLRNAIYGDGSFLYTFFRALGGEYMGMYAYYLASPLSYIVAIFPQDRILEALLTIILIKAGLCGFTFGFYLHKHSKHPNKPMVIAFSVMYALCAFAVVHQNNIMWTDAMFWMPIVTYSIEQLIKHGKYKLYVISLAITLMSNYYIGYMVCIWCVIYFVYYFCANDKDIVNPRAKKLHALKSTVRFGAFSIIAASIAGFILLSAYYSLTFGKSDFSNPNWSLSAKFDILDFFTKLLPGTYDTVRPEGLPFVYCGILSLITAPVYFMTRAIKSREKIASLTILAFLVLCFIASPLDLIWHGFQNPNWLNHRYSFMFCFVLLLLGYKGFGNLRRCSEKFILGVCAFIVLFVAICQKQEFETYKVTDKALETFSTVILSIVITVVLLVFLCLLIRTRSIKKREGITAVLAAVICVEVFLSSLSLVIQFDDDVTYSGYNRYNEFLDNLRPVVEQVKQDDTSFYRMEKLVHRKYNDNMALGIRGLSNSTSTLNSSTIEFLNNMGYTSRSHLSKYQGGNPVNDSLLGIKYFIDETASEKLSHYFENISEGEIYDVYQNPYVLSLAYGVSKNINDFDFEEYNTYFEKLNSLVGAMRGTKDVPELFKPITDFSEKYLGCDKDLSATRAKYTAKSEDLSATVSFTFTATVSAEYYFYTPSPSPKKCTISVNGTSLGEYLGSDTRHIFSLGYFEEGKNVEVKITLEDEPLSIYTNCDYIWYLNRDEFEVSFADLLDNPQFVIDDDYEEDCLTGTITTTEENTTILSTISYDKGWHVYVDGQELETYQTLDALMAFDIESAGEHSLEFKYMPDEYKTGMLISVTGIGLFILICAADFVLKHTLLKSRRHDAFDAPWVLEDFDEDYVQMNEWIPEENSETPALKDKISDKIKKFKNKNSGDD